MPVNYLSPSVLNADFSNLAEEISKTQAGGAHKLHLDIMDGQFVPNISFGPGVVSSIRNCTTLELDCHLMIHTPEILIPEFAKAGANHITVHYESTNHLDRLVQLIKAHGCTAGVSLNPATSVQLLEPILDQLDLVLIMSVNPGFGGQKFLEYTMEKVRWLRAQKPELNIQVDGGINKETLPIALAAGANNFVIGSAIFGQSDVISVTKSFCSLLEQPT